MARRVDIDLLNPGDTQKKLLAVHIALTILVVLVALVLFLREPPVGWQAPVLSLLLGMLVLLPVHELVHGLCFKLLGDPGIKVQFGFKNGCLYASAPGARLSPARVLVVILAPFVLLTPLAWAVVMLLTGDVLAAWLLVGFHAAGCAGDFYLAAVILRTAGVEDVEDTSTGVTLYCVD